MSMEGLGQDYTIHSDTRTIAALRAYHWNGVVDLSTMTVSVPRLYDDCIKCSHRRHYLQRHAQYFPLFLFRALIHGYTGSRGGPS